MARPPTYSLSHTHSLTLAHTHTLSLSHARATAHGRTVRLTNDNVVLFVGVALVALLMLSIDRMLFAPDFEAMCKSLEKNAEMYRCAALQVEPTDSLVRTRRNLRTVYLFF